MMLVMKKAITTGIPVSMKATRMPISNTRA